MTRREQLLQALPDDIVTNSDQSPLVTRLLTEAEFGMVSGGGGYYQGGNYTQTGGAFTQSGGGTHSQTGNEPYGQSPRDREQ